MHLPGVDCGQPRHVRALNNRETPMISLVIATRCLPNILVLPDILGKSTLVGVCEPKSH